MNPLEDEVFEFAHEDKWYRLSLNEASDFVRLRQFIGQVENDALKGSLSNFLEMYYKESEI